MNKDKYIVVRGVLFWAKIVGEARPYTGNPKFNKGPSWSVDITPDAKSRKIIADAGISDKLREPKGDKETRKETYLSLRQLLLKADGTKNNPPKISNANGQPWNGDLIGNGSIADIKVKVKDYGETTGAYMVETRILKHVPFEGGGGFEPLSEDDEFFAQGDAPMEAELDDEAPY